MDSRLNSKLLSDGSVRKIVIMMAKRNCPVCDVSSRIESDNVQGQMYFWDISEDPNVVIRQSHLEEFLLSVLSNTSGVSISFYQQLVGYLSPHLSDRFKKSVVNNMEKVGDIYLLKIPHKE